MYYGHTAGSQTCMRCGGGGRSLALCCIIKIPAILVTGGKKFDVDDICETGIMFRKSVLRMRIVLPPGHPTRGVPIILVHLNRECP